MPKASFTPTIMVVDDQALQIQLMTGILKEHHINNICSTQDPRLAVQLYHHYHPDLVLLDLNMPYMNGFEVAVQLQNASMNEEVFIVMFTSDNDQSNRIKALEQGVKDFIIKPFDPVEVMLRIRNMLETKALYRKVQDQVEILDQRVREKTRDLEETYLDLLNRLGSAAKYRDNETGLHVNRISLYAASLGQAMGMSKAECDMLYCASALHDIGKIGIPDSILLKEGPLSDEEWTMMKTHTTIGASILSSSSSKVIQMAEMIALDHHERWDGTGYPNNLMGEEICIYARITALCDVFDALMSERPYKKPWSYEAAIEAIRLGKGNHFDPSMTEIFLAILPKVYRQVQSSFIQ